jgi:hypothetical protein
VATSHYRKDEVVRIAPVTQGTPFPGLRIFPGLIRLEGKKWARLRRQVRVLEAQYACVMIDEATLACSVASMSNARLSRSTKRLQVRERAR